MSERLEQIKKEIEAVTMRYEKLGQDIQDINVLIVSKRSEHARAIAKEEDTGNLGDEIVKLQTRLKGAQQAHELLTTELRDLQKKKAVEDRAVQLERAESAGREAMNAAEDAYLVFVDLVDKFLTLRTKAREFRGMLRQHHPTPLRYRSQKSDQLCEAIEKGLPPILELFPKEIFIDENLLKPDDLKRKLRRYGAVVPFDSGNLIPPSNLSR